MIKKHITEYIQTSSRYHTKNIVYISHMPYFFLFVASNMDAFSFSKSFNFCCILFISDRNCPFSCFICCDSFNLASNLLHVFRKCAISSLVYNYIKRHITIKSNMRQTEFELTQLIFLLTFSYL